MHASLTPRALALLFGLLTASRRSPDDDAHTLFHDERQVASELSFSVRRRVIQACKLGRATEREQPEKGG